MTSFLKLLDASDGAVFGTWVKLPTTESVELLALAGFDFVVIDMEHAPLHVGAVHDLIGAARGRGLPALVRVPDRGQSTISRVLDSGASGVLVPHVDTVGDAETVMSAARFPPHGTRGYGPTVRAGGWGTDAAGYRASGGQVAVIPQLESRAAIDRARNIGSVAGTSALFVGPADLAVATGLPAGSAEFAELVTSVEEAAAEMQVPIGTAVGADPVAARDLAERYDFVMLANDASLLHQGAVSLLEATRGC